MPELAQYYDNIYRSMILNTASLGWEWLNERIAKITPLVVGESVLDIGCGLGIIADYIDGRRYLGIDFSNFAVKWSNNNIKNPIAAFAVANVENFYLGEKYDTVLLLEVLEHIADIEGVAKLAEFYAEKRLIVTVPRNMPGKGHVKHEWSTDDIQYLFGQQTECELFGGPENDRWLLAIRDYENT